jgi:hypothetical protein
MTPRERFDALDERDKETILDKYRHWNTEHEWYDSTYDMFKEDMAAKGIHVTNMYFSGFRCQGDGACFEGRVCNWPVFLKDLGYDSQVLIDFAKDTWDFSVKHSGRYYHENCTSFDSDMPNPDGEDDDYFIEKFCKCTDPEDLRAIAELTILRSFDYESMTDEFVEMFKGNMRSLYRALEAEYDYLTSDEAVLDSLEANDQLEDAINTVTEDHHEHI